MKKRRFLAMVWVLFVLTGGVESVRADDARVLPRGVWSASIEDQIYFPITERFNPSGDTEPLGTDLSGNLGTNIAPGLAAFQGAPFNIPDPSLGRSVVSEEYEVNELRLSVFRGITDRLSIGAKIPYVWARNKVSAGVDSSTANIGVNTNFNGTAANGPPFLPLGLPGVRPVTTEDMQQYISTGLVINGVTVPGTGLGFKRVESWSNEGLGDIDVGFKYQYLNTPSWRLAATAGVRMPTGEEDDPYNLVDRGLGSGIWSGLFYLNNDYTGIKGLLVDATFRYFLTFPDHATVRVVNDPRQPFSGFFTKIDRNAGDVIEAEGSVSYELLKGTSLFATYKFGRGFATRATYNGATLAGLEKDSDYTEQVILVGLGYNTLPLYLEKRFPVPMSGSIAYRNRFAGTNYVLKSEYIAVMLSFFF